ncbi:MAG: reverse transcriptase family protein, partial [Saccharospirillaceae bacterium]|nr:reverse transcriptase family protein [Saccharospirillaceae bacterium]
KPLSNKQKKKKKPWFSSPCDLARKQVNKAAHTADKFPQSDFLRINYYKVKSAYKKITKRTKENYFNKLNTDIENGKILSWQNFKKLKTNKENDTKFDSLDMEKFQKFFTELYSDSHATVPTSVKNDLIDKADEINMTGPHSTVLDSPITLHEINETISTLKSGKAAGPDMIANEILKNLNHQNQLILTKLYNLCFDNSVYPWSSSIITPLHKKGSLDDPDNYRAVAVSSAIGKLFSTILLERIVKHRSANCPDPPNQLGFTKKAQTYDHILTMKTITSKYKKLKRNVFSVFVDFRKAFDSICRQALFYKLSSNGITGKVYNILRNMYANSTSQIKLNGRLSESFSISKGTEQGHPLSPELFKLFLNDLSPLLEFNSCQLLSNKLISHLLWADDLILLALDPKTLQKQIDKLGQYCREWGIEINFDKTKVMIFGDIKRDKPRPSFILDNKILAYTESYCYLGIILHESGKDKYALENLTNKARRAFYSLKRTVNRTKLSFQALTTLFDSLIKPIALYGAPICTPSLSILKNIASSINHDPPALDKFCSKLAKIKYENLHLSFLKWAMGIHRKSSNIGTWGDSGRYPLIYQGIKLTLNYLKRLDDMGEGSFVYAALQDQKKLNLPWYKNIEPILKLDERYNMDHVTAASNSVTNTNIINNNTNTTTNNNNINKIEIPDDKCKKSSGKVSSFLIHNGFIRAPDCHRFNVHFDQVSHLEIAEPVISKIFDPNKIFKITLDHLKKCWSYNKSISSKLTFYHSIKHEFKREFYLSVIKKANYRHSLSKLRVSAHDLSIEKGRYINLPRDDRICRWCHLTVNTKVVEDEHHVLHKCDLYHHKRSVLKNLLNDTLAPDQNQNIEYFDFMDIYLSTCIIPHLTQSQSLSKRRISNNTSQ